MKKTTRTMKAMLASILILVTGGGGRSTPLVNRAVLPLPVEE
jgi:hypothetical protein